MSPPTMPIHEYWLRARVLLGNLTVVQWLRVLWLALVFWSEHARYTFASSCAWNDKDLVVHGASKPVNVLILTDARVHFPPIYKSSLFGDVYEWFYELGLRRTWHAALSMKPHLVIFLGDMLASGRKVKHSIDFTLYYESFKRVFSRGSQKGMTMYYVPGNEDIGLNLKAADAHRARLNYIDHFGPPNRAVSVANNTLVLLDAPGLVEEDYQRAQSLEEFDTWVPLDSGPVEFVRGLEHQNSDELRILFSHIPLARYETASCGPLRTKAAMHRGVGPGYQNMLGKQTTEFLLKTVKPAIVFSGDDRDYCEIRHSVAIDGTESFIPEISIKSFSPVKDVPDVGFQLLSLAPHPHVSPSTHSSAADATADDATIVHTQPTFAHAPCFLPAPIDVYSSVYLPLTVFTLLVLLMRNYYRMHWGPGARRRVDDLISPLQTAFPPGTSRMTIALPSGSGAGRFEMGHKSSLSRSHRVQISVDRDRMPGAARLGFDDKPTAPPQTWTFMFNGRRRRLWLRRPPFVGPLLAWIRRRVGSLPGANTPVSTLLGEFVSIAWPALLLWMWLAWWIM